MIMPAFGAYTGALNLRDRAFAGLFREEKPGGLGAWREPAIPVAGTSIDARLSVSPCGR